MRTTDAQDRVPRMRKPCRRRGSGAAEPDCVKLWKEGGGGPTFRPNVTEVQRDNFRSSHECPSDNMSQEYATKLRTATREKLRKFNFLRGE